MTIAITILAGVAAVVFGRFLSSRPTLLDSPRLPKGARFAESEALAVAAVLRFAGLVALAGIILVSVFRLTA